jgi:serine/threonine-protein kinase
VDARTDLYAVGVLGYQLLTGGAPFTGRSAAEILVAHLQQIPRPPHEVRPGIPPALSAVLLRALAKQPEARFSTASQMRAALEASLAAARTPPPLPESGLFTARVPVHGSLGVREYPCERVGRTGLFLRTGNPPPPLLEDVSLLLRLPGGELACTGQVVRHVTAEQAQAWNMVPGFGVELRDTTAAFQQTFARLVAGEKPAATTPSAPLQDDARAEPVLREFRHRLAGDHYAVLGLPRDADADTVRTHAREARNRLEPLLTLPLSPAQRDLVQRALARVAEALLVLGHVERRVEYDAELHNVGGVLRCLAAGLTVTTLEACRRRYIARHPQTEGHSVLHLASGDVFRSAGRLSEALSAYEAALRVDPLHLEALKRWHAVKARVRPSASTAAHR